MDIDFEKWAQLGFSFFVAVYLLVKTQQKLEEIAIILEAIEEILEKHIEEKDLAIKLLQDKYDKVH